MVWTADHIWTLARMASTHSASQIATALGSGFTRNAVIGKCHREGIALRSNNHAKAEMHSEMSAVATGNRRGKHVRPTSTLVCPEPLPTFIPVPVDPVCSHVDFEGLKTRSCRWPVKCDDMGYIRLYCGEMAQESGPYCAAHHKKSFVVPDRRSLPNHSVKKLFGVGFA